MMIPRKDYDFLGDLFTDPFFSKNESKVMKTDIKEKDDKYLIYVDLPGYEKENIKIDIDDGYLTVTGEVNNTKENKQEDGSFVRKERYIGTCTRSFYIGEDITEDEVKASFKNGVLNIEIPKKEEKKIQEKKYIQID